MRKPKACQTRTIAMRAVGSIFARMTKWISPDFVEIKMDAEIGSYQDDTDRDREVPAFVSPESTETAE